jgi:phosphoribosylformimino-5-aminoimidazole carboxamide ribotide isomerase
MSFEVIPAIDVMGGRIARLRTGDPGTLHVYSGDPVVLAEGFIAQGARWIHFVDLDAAFGSGASNVDLLRQVAGLPVHVQAGGGLSPQEAETALEAGATRAVIGAASLTDRASVHAALASLGEAVAVGLDVRDGRIVPRGSGVAGGDADEAATWLAAEGCPRVVYTDVSRDGAMRGPDLVGLRALAAVFPGRIISSGGIRSRDDLDSVEALGIEGAIVGTALYEAGLDLGEVLRS